MPVRKPRNRPRVNKKLAMEIVRLRPPVQIKNLVNLFFVV
jgi:hypothetical protein